MPHARFLRAVVVACCLGWTMFSSHGVLAGPLPAPKGKVILTLTGAIDQVNHEGTAQFDRAMLEALGPIEVKTGTPFTQGESVYRGVRLRDLLRAVGARGSKVQASAVNLYTAEIPISDFERYDVILAMEVDGQPLRLRDKGPLWILYPFGSHAELNSDKMVERRSVWQLMKLDVQ